MADVNATSADRIDLIVGEARTLESLRQAVVPPFVLIVPFLELPPFVRQLGQDGLAEDGVHGCVYAIEAEAPGAGPLRVGFRDLRTGTVVKEKTLRVEAVRR